VLNTAMNLCSTAGQRDVSLALFHSLHGLSLLPNVCTFNTAMNTYFADGRWDEALRLLEDMWDAFLMPDI
ncbi:ASPHD2, partial [Symbiodinium microadriaticum]